jgi:16S rRNA (guanine527-N7)-methyltransferase
MVEAWLASQGLPAITETQLGQLAAFQERLIEVNRHMNLTSITLDEDIAVKHFIDSLSILPWIKQRAVMLDIGTGAGFPGVPVRIVRGDTTLTLLDSLRKRILFLRDALDALGLDGTPAECVHGRAEEWNRREGYRAVYDICVARAVARLEILARYALPFLKPGGLFLAMKGPETAEEINEAHSAIRRFGGAVAEVRRINIADDITHSVIVVEKRL